MQDPLAAQEQMDPQDRAIFNQLIHPSDSYTPDGVYWADLPVGQRIKFINQSNNAEAKEELGWLWDMFKKDPLSPITYYFKNFVVPGAGLGLEGYVLFSISNNTSLFDVSFKDCWKSYKTCNKNWVAAVNYLEVVGILIGQILVGFIGDWTGRRWSLIQDAGIMLLGLIMLTAAWGTTTNGWVICYAWSLFIYSIGVGGEYPMTATIGMEDGVKSGKISTRDDRLHRGRKIVGAFLMQGWGQFFNQVILIIFLLIFHHGSGEPPISKVATQWTYRVSFAIPAVGTLWLVYYRAYHMPAANRQLQVAKKKHAVTGYDTQSLKLTFKYFGSRLVATAGAWFANDVFFYGNKLFQSKFIKVIEPNSTSVITSWSWNLLNIAVELAGYYGAMWFVDNKLVGRKWLQILGFMLCFILFIVPAFAYHHYTEAANIHSFQAMYYLSSFFNQFGPNCVTFLVAAEVFPTSVRATAHGLGAATGKLGALVIAIVGSYTTTQQQFYIVPWFGLFGALVTLIFLPDTTGLDLHEQERYWSYLRSGREHAYHGTAVHPQHLSSWERWRGKGKHYDAARDYEQKVRDFRAQWETAMAESVEEKSGLEADDEDEKILEGPVAQYFLRTRAGSTEKEGGAGG
ncbi:MFS phosphate transporter [Teratosphaeria destructans]|uniref:MFS phosphate transporter n=1 Tax=Teratosphaeria destructans TaxID=418781 RepID=A0A9W7W466_9PEZI|nr:MFS phosphate transporter [Teratosphaeria destructans]